jgi:hypothetical protein
VAAATPACGGVKKLTSTNIFTVGDEVSIASVDTNVCCWAHTDEIRRRSKVGFEGQTGMPFCRQHRRC